MVAITDWTLPFYLCVECVETLTPATGGYRCVACGCAHCDAHKDRCRSHVCDPRGEDEE